MHPSSALRNVSSSVCRNAAALAAVFACAGSAVAKDSFAVYVDGTIINPGLVHGNPNALVPLAINDAADHEESIQVGSNHLIEFRVVAINAGTSVDLILTDLEFRSPLPGNISNELLRVTIVADFEVSVGGAAFTHAHQFFGACALPPHLTGTIEKCAQHGAPGSLVTASCISDTAAAPGGVLQSGPTVSLVVVSNVYRIVAEYNFVLIRQGPGTAFGAIALPSSGHDRSFVEEPYGWSPVGGPASAEIDDLVDFVDVPRDPKSDPGSVPTLWAGGGFTSIGGVAANRIARWDGRSWSALGSGVDDTVRALTIHDDGLGEGPVLYVGGDFLTAGGLPASRLARFDGVSWSAVPVDGPQGAVRALQSSPVSATGRPALYVGALSWAEPGFNRIGAWDGFVWTNLDGGLNNTVNAFAVFDDGSGPALHAGGFFTSTDGGLAVGRIASWSLPASTGGACGEGGSCFMPSASGGCDDEECCFLVCAAAANCCEIAWDVICVAFAEEVCDGDPCTPCTGDLNADGVVDGADLGLLLLSWSLADECVDFNGDGVVNGADLGLMLLNWGPCPLAGCPLALPPGWIPEGEACGDDVNGGCNDPPNFPFTPIDCGSVVRGHAWAAGGVRDTDFYEFVVTQPVTGVLRVDTTLPLIVGIITAPTTPLSCGLPLTILPALSLGECESGSIAYCFDQGSHWIFVAPLAFDGYPCGSGFNDYLLTLDCVAEVCPAIGAICMQGDHGCLTAGGPGCNDPLCCEIVCLWVDPFCCDQSWDEICVILANRHCAHLFTGPCGDPSAGSCFRDHLGLGCRDGGCCELVCTNQPQCCTVAWDASCVVEALGVCETCDPACPPDAVVQNDDDPFFCFPLVGDPNGGCVGAGSHLAVQYLGAMVTTGQSLIACGTVGTDPLVGIADLDVFTVDLPFGGHLSVVISHSDGSGLAAAEICVDIQSAPGPMCTPIGFTIACGDDCPVVLPHFYLPPGSYAISVTTFGGLLTLCPIDYVMTVRLD